MQNQQIGLISARPKDIEGSKERYLFGEKHTECEYFNQRSKDVTRTQQKPLVKFMCVPCFHSHARSELPQAIDVFVAMIA